MFGHEGAAGLDIPRSRHRPFPNNELGRATKAKLPQGFSSRSEDLRPATDEPSLTLGICLTPRLYPVPPLLPPDHRGVALTRDSPSLARSCHESWQDG